MNNAFTGEVVIEVGGENHTLAFTWKRLAALETTLGKDGLEAQKDLPAINTLVAFLEAGTGGSLTAEKLEQSKTHPYKMVPLVRQALGYFYFGPEETAGDETETDNGKDKPAGKSKRAARAKP